MKVSNPLLFKAKQNSLPRNAFDLSHHSYFTSPTGLILPAYVEDINPGDYLKIDVQNFTRTQPCATAAFVRIREAEDFYFVPYRLLWRWFPEFYTSIQNTDSSYNPNSTNIPSALPYISGQQIYDILNDVSNSFFDFVTGTPAAHKFVRLLDMLGYPVGTDLSETKALYQPGTGNPVVNRGPFNQSHFNVFRLFAYMRVYHDFYRQTDYEVNDPTMYNLDKYASGGQISTADLKNALIYCGYKNWAKDRFTSLKPSPLSSTFDKVNNFVGQAPHLTPSDT